MFSSNSSTAVPPLPQGRRGGSAGAASLTDTAHAVLPAPAEWKKANGRQLALAASRTSVRRMPAEKSFVSMVAPGSAEKKEGHLHKGTNETILTCAYGSDMGAGGYEQSDALWST